MAIARDFVNDDSILPTEALLLRVPPDQVVFDKNRNLYRASGQAFYDEELSVYLDSVLKEHGCTETDVLYGHPAEWSVAQITAAAARSESQIIVRDPMESMPPRPYDAAHALVVGKKPTKCRRRLSKATHLVVEGDVSHCATHE